MLLIMPLENKRRFERIQSHTKVKLPGESGWAECYNSNISGSGLYFDTAKQLQVGDFVNLQFMLHTESTAIANVHFFASAKVVRVIPGENIFQTAVEFIIDDAVRKEILKVIEIIKGQNLKVDRPTATEAVLQKNKPQ
jgi:Tfp pilus assembly protein PilZ